MSEGLVSGGTYVRGADVLPSRRETIAPAAKNSAVRKNVTAQCVDVADTE